MEKKKSYVTGIIGAILGGLIASIPWILLYVYANIIASFSALIIALGALKGYEIFNGKMSKGLPWIIAIISILSVSVATFLVIPNLLLYKEYGIFSLANFKLLYESHDFVVALLTDYMFSLLFTALGISGVIKNIHTQINLGDTNIDVNNRYPGEEEKIKETFTKLNALDKNTAISKEELDSNLKLDDNVLLYFIRKGCIKVTKGRYYYKEVNKKKNIILVIAVIVVFFILGFASSLLSNDIKEDARVITYDLPSSYEEFTYNSNGEVGYTIYPKKDLSGDSGEIHVYYYTDATMSGDDTAKTIEEYLKEEDGYVTSKIYNNEYGYQVLEGEFDLEGFTEYFYYVFNDEKYAFIDSFTKDTKNNIKKDSAHIANTLKWND